MPYTLVYSGGTITVNDETLNTNTSLSFPGRNYSGYGVFLNQNLLSLLENFASSTGGPSNSIRGQIWFDASNNSLKYNTSTTVGSPTWVEVFTSNTTININNLLPSQSGQSGKFLTTNGSVVSWGTPTTYTLPTASASTLGGIKVGSGLVIDGSGVLSATGGGGGGGGVTQIIAGTNVTISSTGAGGTGIVTINSTGGGGGGSGTVTSVGINSSDMTVTNSPITGTGSIGLSLNTVPISKGGTGQTTATAAINALLPSQTGNSGAYLTTNGSVASWAPVSAQASNTGYVTLPGNLRLGWGVVDFGDIYSGHDTAYISYGGIFSTVYNVQVQLQRYSGTGGDAYPIITSSTISPYEFTVFLRETQSGVGYYKIYWQAIGSAPAAGTPTNLSFSVTSWTNNGLTSTLVLDGSAVGTAPLAFSWSIDGGATYPYTNVDPVTISGISNTTQFLTVVMKVSNPVTGALPNGVTYTQILENPYYSGGGGGGGGGGPIP